MNNSLTVIQRPWQPWMIQFFVSFILVTYLYLCLRFIIINEINKTHSTVSSPLSQENTKNTQTMPIHKLKFPIFSLSPIWNKHKLVNRFVVPSHQRSYFWQQIVYHLRGKNNFVLHFAGKLNFRPEKAQKRNISLSSRV